MGGERGRDRGIGDGGWFWDGCVDDVVGECGGGEDKEDGVRGGRGEGKDGGGGKGGDEGIGGGEGESGIGGDGREGGKGVGGVK